MRNAPKARITEETAEESRRLKSIWARTGHGGLTQDEFGARYGIGTQAAVGFFLNGKSPLSLKAAIGFASGLGCQIGDFSARLATVAQQASAVNQLYSNAAEADDLFGSAHPQPARADPLANSLADKMADLGDMLAVFASEEVLNMAYMHCVMAVQQFKFELSQRENKRRDATLAAAPILKTEKRP